MSGGGDGKMKKHVIAIVAWGIVCGAFACGEDAPPPGGEQTGQSCTQPGQCFPTVPDGGLRGAAVCLDRVMGGYCTHLCATDADCCAVPGECRTSYPQVCSPFESTGMKYCFLSCEDVPDDAGVIDTETYCHTYAHAAFGCRSSGGGSENRKVCVP
jgi:hypothetical protein